MHCIRMNHSERGLDSVKFLHKSTLTFTVDICFLPKRNNLCKAAERFLKGSGSRFACSKVSLMCISVVH